MKYFIIVLFVLLYFLSLNAFISDRFGDYEYFSFYESLQTGKLNSSYPIIRKDIIVDFDNLFEEYLYKRIEKREENKIFIDANLYRMHDDSVYYGLNLYPEIEFKLANKIYAGIGIFFETGDRNLNGYTAHTQEFNGNIVIGGFNKGYISYINNNFIMALGRLRYNKSFDFTSMMFDYNAPPTDGIWISGKLPNNFSYDFNFLSLGYTYAFDNYFLYEPIYVGDLISRFLNYHSISYSPLNYLSFTFSESVVWGRKSFTGFDYFFPFFLYYGEQDNININDNVLWQFRINYDYLNKINTEIALLIDDYQYEQEGVYDMEPPMLGLSAKIYIHSNYGYTGFIFHRINAWVYNQKYMWNKYQYNDINLGYPYAPDIIDFIITSYYALNENSGIKGDIGYYGKGANITASEWIFPIEEDDLYYYENSILLPPVCEYIIYNLEYNYMVSNIDFVLMHKLKYCLQNESVENSIQLKIKLYI